MSFSLQGKRKKDSFQTGKSRIHIHVLCFNAVVAGLSNTETNPNPDVKGPGFGVWPTCLWPNTVSDYLRKSPQNTIPQK